MRQFVVYRNPVDFPGRIVVRGFTIGIGVITPDPAPTYIGESVYAARQAIRAIDPGLIQLWPSRDDEPQIVEIWI
jgi:hypothetical protein